LENRQLDPAGSSAFDSTPTHNQKQPVIDVVQARSKPGVIVLLNFDWTLLYIAFLYENRDDSENPQSDPVLTFFVSLNKLLLLENLDRINWHISRS
jgi:hypothetical protein